MILQILTTFQVSKRKSSLNFKELYNFYYILSFQNKSMSFGNGDFHWTYLVFSPQPPMTSLITTNFYGNYIPPQQPPSSTQQSSVLNILSTQSSNNNLQRTQIGHQEVQVSGEQESHQKQKIFKKDKWCPVSNCKKRYSSRIALRSHLRKQHPCWMQETSDYEP